MHGIELSLQNQFIRFLIVGSVGFIIDTAVLYIGLYLIGFDRFTGRLFSYIIAATTTWYLHRKFTFSASDTSKPLRQWGHFLVANGIGGLINFGIYSLVVIYGKDHYLTPLIGIFLGSVAGLAFNFIISRTLVFKTKY
jgi:putative flippase GtrA